MKQQDLSTLWTLLNQKEISQSIFQGIINGDCRHHAFLYAFPAFRRSKKLPYSFLHFKNKNEAEMFMMHKGLMAKLRLHIKIILEQNHSLRRYFPYGHEYFHSCLTVIASLGGKDETEAHQALHTLFNGQYHQYTMQSLDVDFGID